MPVDTKKLAAEIEDMQRKLEELRAQLRAAQPTNGAASVAELYGILGGALHADDDDLAAVRAKVEWDRLLPRN